MSAAARKKKVEPAAIEAYFSEDEISLAGFVTAEQARARAKGSERLRTHYIQIDRQIRWMSRAGFYQTTVYVESLEPHEAQEIAQAIRDLGGFTVVNHGDRLDIDWKA